MKPGSDEELLQASIANDPEFFSQLVGRYERRVFGMLIRATGRRQDAEDLFQGVFMAAFSARVGFKGKSKFSTWLYAITLNQLRHWRRGLARRPQHLELAEAPEPGVWSKVLERLAGRDEERRLERVLRQLPELEQDLLQLRYFEELSVKETALALGLQDGVVRVRTHRALAKLKKLMEDQES